MMLTEKELKEMEARANAATEGPWGINPRANTNIVGPNDRGIGAFAGYQSFDPNDEELPFRIDRENRANAIFAAAVRSDLPRLIAALRETRAVIDTVGDHLTDLCGPEIIAAIRGYNTKRFGEEVDQC